MGEGDIFPGVGGLESGLQGSSSTTAVGDPEENNGAFTAAGAEGEGEADITVATA